MSYGKNHEGTLQLSQGEQSVYRELCGISIPDLCVCTAADMGTGTLIQKPLYKPLHQQGNGGQLEI